MKKAVFISCFGWYEERIEPIIGLIQNKYEVRVYLSDFDHIKKSYIENKIGGCEYVHTLAYKSNLSIRRVVSHILFAKRICRILMREQPDFIYALLPPNSIAKECADYKKRNQNIYLVFDLIDMWPESMPKVKKISNVMFDFWKKLRDDSFSLANHIFTECELYQNKLGLQNKENVTTLHLYKEIKSDDRDRVLSIINEKRSNDNISICYLGSINNIIDIDGIEKIIAYLSTETAIDLVIIGDGEKRVEFLERMSNYSVNIKYYGKIFEEQKKIDILAKCDFALNMMRETVSVGLTIKSIDYFSYGLPLINNIKGDTWSIIQDEGIGINVSDDWDELARQIKNLLNMDHKKILRYFDDNFTKDVYIKNLEESILHFRK